MDQKHLQGMYHANVTLSLMVAKVTRIKIGIKMQNSKCKNLKKTCLQKRLYVESCYM